MANVKNLKRDMLALEIDLDELAIAIGEAAMHVRRKPGMSTADALNAMNEMSDPADGPLMGDGFRAAAMAAMLFFRDAIEKGMNAQ